MRDEDGKGWEGCATRELNLRSPCSRPCPLARLSGSAGWQWDRFPAWTKEAGSRGACGGSGSLFALSLYGPHAVGTDLDENERAMLSRLARFAAAMYAELEAVELRHQIAMLERKFKAPSQRMR